VRAFSYHFCHFAIGKHSDRDRQRKAPAPEENAPPAEAQQRWTITIPGRQPFTVNVVQSATLIEMREQYPTATEIARGTARRSEQEACGVAACSQITHSEVRTDASAAPAPDVAAQGDQGEPAFDGAQTTTLTDTSKTERPTEPTEAPQRNAREFAEYRALVARLRAS